MKRPRKEYTQFDRRYDELTVDVEKIDPYRDELLTQSEVVTLLGRMATNIVTNLQRFCERNSRELPEDIRALQTISPDDLLLYYKMGRGISWGDADKIVDAWIIDGWEDFQRCVSTYEPGLSEASEYEPNS